ncbi:UNVERIFIED_CONTAM: hypothetical protein PYX00_010505 [Menopon gallinae]|uniref:Cytochrome b561 domain-containing protein n=1 Tax=Menopon gallinae TaxID=328185 RepID=A0AAW2HGD7_9NEOP
MARNKSAKQKKFETEDNDWGCINWCEYMIVITLTSLLLISTVSLVLFWALYYREGFAWRDNPQKEFNLHPVLMVTGFIFFSGFSLLLYRICRCCRRLYVKLGHAILHSLAIPCIVLGFLAVWDSKNLSQPKGTNFYSLHSWLGLVTIGLFLVQFLVGFFSFLILICCQGKTKSCRAGLVPIHSSFGITIYMLAVATCLTGFAEKAIYTLG